MATRMTRKALAKANNRAHASDDDDEDDEAPEVVSKQSATAQALEQRRHEKEAAVAVALAASNKRKRKTRSADATDDATAKTDDGVKAGSEPADEEAAPELPDDVLSALAFREEEVRTEQAIEASRERRKRAAPTKQPTHIRDFGTVKVQTLETVDGAGSRALTAAAGAFLDRRAAPQRPRMNVMEGHASLFTKKQKARAQRA